jgi:hypothetical protein
LSHATATEECILGVKLFLEFCFETFYVLLNIYPLWGGKSSLWKTLKLLLLLLMMMQRNIKTIYVRVSCREACRSSCKVSISVAKLNQKLVCGPDIKYENPFSGSGVLTCGQTDRKTLF